MFCCCVPFCRYTSENSEGITFHSFPAKQVLRAAWLRLLNKNEGQVSEESMVCSKHFLFTDFYFADGIRKLRHEALPSVVQVCLICLDTDSKLISITKHKLKQAYEDLTGLMLCKEANLCVECTMRLKNFKTFRNKSLRSNSLVAELVEKHKILRIQDVKTVNRETNNLTSSLVHRTFKPNQCDLSIFEYMEDDAQNELKDVLDNDTKNNTADAEIVMLVDDYAKIEYLDSEEETRRGYKRDSEVGDEDMYVGCDDGSVSSNSYDASGYTMWFRQSDDDANETEFLLPDEHDIEIKKELIHDENVFGCVVCDEVFTDERLFNEHTEIHTHSVQSRVNANSNTARRFGALHGKRARNEHKYVPDNTTPIPSNTLKRTTKPNVKENSMFSEDFDETSELHNTMLPNVYQHGDKLYILENGKLVKVDDKDDEALEYNVQNDSIFDNKQSAHHRSAVNTDKNVLRVLSYNKADKINTNDGKSFKSDHSLNISKHRNLVIPYDEQNDNILDKIKSEASENVITDDIDERTRSNCSENKKSKKPKNYNDYENSHYCHVCSRHFTQNSALQNHLKVHYGRQNHLCHVCSESFATPRALDIHLQSHVEKSSAFTCGICERKFNDRANLKKHMKSHADKKTFQCDFCEYKSSSYKLLAKHQRTHANPNESLLMCDICKKTFANKYNLRSHMKLHTGENMFTCDYCGKKFALKWNLVFHLRTHTGEKPFTCELCQYNFSSANNLKRHWKIHTGEKPYACPLCSYRCIQSNTLRTHMRTHTGEKPFACEVCDYRCTERRTLKKHMKVHAGEEQHGSKRISNIRPTHIEYK